MGQKCDSKICTFAWTYLSVSKNCVRLPVTQITCTCVAYCFFLEIVKVKLSTEHHNTIWINRLLFSAATSCTSNNGHINNIMDCMKVLLTPIYYKACWPSARGFNLIQPKFKYILADAFKINSSPYVSWIGRQQCTQSTIKLLKIWTPQKFAVITLKFEQGGFIVE